MESEVGTKGVRTLKNGLDSITDSMDMSLSKLQEIVKGRKAWCTAVHGVTELDTTWQWNYNPPTPHMCNAQSLITSKTSPATRGRTITVCSVLHSVP